MVLLTTRQLEIVRRVSSTYNVPFVFDRNGMKNPYMRPDRRVRVYFQKWWFHGYCPVYGRVVQRLSPNEIHVLKPFLNDWQHKIQHNMAKYGPVVLFGGSFVYGYTSYSVTATEEAYRKIRF